MEFHFLSFQDHEVHVIFFFLENLKHWLSDTF